MNSAPASSAVERAQRALNDGSALRVVGRARLSVDHADQAWAAQQALEDGLSTADFADCGRLIVVRSLQLRRLEPGARGPAFARAIETAWRALAPSAVAFDAPSAASAPAVYFRSATAARLAWLQRVAEGHAVDDWFWHSALPELAGAPLPQTAMPAVVDRLWREAPQALSDAWVRWPVAWLRRLFAALPRPLPAAWSRWPLAALRQALIDARRSERRDEAACRDETAADAAPGRGETSALACWLAAIDLPDEAQRAWLAALVLTPADPSSLTLARVAAVLVQVDALTDRFAANAAGSASADHTASTSALRVVPALAHFPARSPRGMTDASSPRLATTPPSLAASPAATRMPITPRFTTDRRPWLAGNQATSHGGLLMLLNVLRRLEFETWLDAQTPADRQPLVALLFDRLADRLRVPPDDPHRVLFAAAVPLRSDAVATEAIDGWVRQLRRVLRLHARVGLASVVRREAGIAITATHIDVVMPLHRADLRLRRAGLDSDPGWLPWFGWIVKLHFVDTDHMAADHAAAH